MAVTNPGRMPLSLRFWRLVALVATLVLAAEWQLGAGIGAIGVDTAPVADPLQNSLDLEPGARSTIDTYRTYFDKPAFREDRAPILIAGSDGAFDRPAEIDDVELIGTIITSASELALFRVSGQRDIIRARSGENVGEWTIIGITANTVHLARDSEEITLEIAQGQARGRSIDEDSEGESNDND